MMENVWLIPLLPLIAFVIILFFGRRLEAGSAWIGVATVAVSFLLATVTLAERLSLDQAEPVALEWLTIGERVITMGYEVTPLNALMLFVVSLVSLVVHIYARGYMAGDERISVFYAYLALFTFAMLGLVISPNLLQVPRRFSGGTSMRSAQPPPGRMPRRGAAPPPPLTSTTATVSPRLRSARAVCSSSVLVPAPPRGE